MKVRIKTQGFRELDEALKRIEKKATAKAVMRRALKKAAQPIADLAEAKAPVGDTRTLAPSISVGTKLSKRQRGLHRKMFRKDKAAVEMFVGAGPLSSSWNQEFGNVHHAPKPFMRPAWDIEGMATLSRVGKLMWDEIEKNARRTARRNGWEV